MATDPAFASTPHVGSVVNNATNDTSLTAPTNIATVFTAGANGSKVDVIRFLQVATSAAGGCINVFLYDGTTYHFIDFLQYPALTISATSESLPIDAIYNSLAFPTGWSLRITNTANAAALFNVTAFGADF